MKDKAIQSSNNSLPYENSNIKKNKNVDINENKIKTTPETGQKKKVFNNILKNVATQKNLQDRKTIISNEENKSQLLLETNNFQPQFLSIQTSNANIFLPPDIKETSKTEIILTQVDVEKIVSTIQAQKDLDGTREIFIEMKPTVLKGLQVKILMEPSTQVKIEFFAKNAKIGAKIENQISELTENLLSHKINLQTISVAVSSENDNSAFSSTNKNFPNKKGNKKIDLLTENSNSSIDKETENYNSQQNSTIYSA